MKRFCLLVVALLLAADVSAAGSPVLIAEPSQDRWMYPSNSTPGTRPQASTFSALPGSGGLDDRWGFFMMAFDTSQALPPGLPPELYRIRSIKLTATIGQDQLFRYDTSEDPWPTFATPTVPAALVDDDAGRPLELHGAGFRGGFTPSTFHETSAYGSSVPESRNAYPLGFDAAGIARDVSNNITQQFESVPWAIGKTDALAPGDWVPVDTAFSFAPDLSLPGVTTYLREGLAKGRLWFSLTSLHPATQQAGEFVAWYTRDDIYHQLFGGLAPSLTIEAELNLRITIFRSGNEVHLGWPEFAGFTHTLQASPDLSKDSWQTIHSHTATAASPGGFVETTTEPRRFYRLSLTPAS